MRIDGDAADAINKSKNDFYDKYEYLKPDIEKSWLEEKVDNACEWCKEHWKESHHSNNCNRSSISYSNGNKCFKTS